MVVQPLTSHGNFIITNYHDLKVFRSSVLVYAIVVVVGMRLEKRLQKILRVRTVGRSGCFPCTEANLSLCAWQVAHYLCVAGN